METNANLIKLAEALDLSFLNDLFKKKRSTAGRRDEYKMSSIVKSALINYADGDSEMSVLRRKLLNSPSIRRVCKFNGKVPSESTFSRKRPIIFLLANFIFNWLVKTAKELGLTKGNKIVQDSTDVEAWSNPKKKNPSDPSATWGHSTTKGMVFGYKAHIISDAEADLPLALTVLPANEHDSVAFFPTFKKLQENFTYEVKKFIADSAYDDAGIRQFLRDRFIDDCIARNGRGHYESEKPKDEDYNKRPAAERVNSRGKMLFALDKLKVRGIVNSTVHIMLSLSSLLFFAICAFKSGIKNWRSIVEFR